MQRGEHRAFTLVELLVVIAIIGLLVALLLPAVQSAREAGRRSTCVNNLKQISLAVHSFHSAHGKVPAACYYDETPTWFVLILPYLEDSASYEQWDLHARWHAPVNERARVQNISIYRCPSRNRGRSMTEEFFVGEPHPAAGLGDYAGNAGPRFANLSNDLIPGPDGVWGGQSLTEDGVIILQMWGPATPGNPPYSPYKSKISWKTITDGQSKTFLAGEKHVIDGMYTPSGFLPVSHGGGADGAWCACNEWMFSTRLAGGNPQLIDGQLAYDGAFPIAFGADDDTISQNWIFGSWHPSICHFAMCDGSVHALSVDADPNILGRLAQRHDGEIVAIPGLSLPIESANVASQHASHLDLGCATRSHETADRLWPVFPIAGVLASALTVGCGDDGRLPRYPVTGTVTFADGKPLADGKVIFRSTEHDVRARARILEDGSYQLSTFKRHDGAVAGKHNVVVLPFYDRPDGPPSVPIHPKLQRFDTSGLEFVVTEDGPNRFEIQVEPPN